MDLVLRSLFAFALLWFVLRVGGKRQVAELDSFDLVVIIMIGGLATQGVLQEDYSATGALVTVAVFILLSIALSGFTWRFPRARTVIEGRPTVLLRGGVPDDEAMHAERVTMTNLLEAARSEGVRDLADVDLVVLETSGTYSFFVRSATRGGE